MRAFYIIFCIILIGIFFLSYFFLGENVGIYRYYFGERVDMLVTLFFALLSCGFEIARTSRNTLTGRWDVEFFPEGKKDHKKQEQPAMKQEGTMIIYEKNRKEYLGSMHLSFFIENRIIKQGFYEVELKRKFRKISGTSILKFMKEIEAEAFTEKDAQTRRRTYNLSLTGRNMINGTVQMEAQNTKAAFSATRK